MGKVTIDDIATTIRKTKDMMMQENTACLPMTGGAMRAGIMVYTPRVIPIEMKLAMAL
jgi:hypothetical protein